MAIANQYENLLDIYDRMVEVSDRLHERKDKDEKGFNNALFILKYALTKYEGLNFHVENKRLKNENTALTAKAENQKAELIRLQIENKKFREHVFKLKFGGTDDLPF